MSNEPSIRVLELRQAGPVLVCRKCLKRIANGGKLRKRLRIGLKQHGAGRKKHRARLVLTNCFGICPKGAVVAASPSTLARHEFLLIRDGSEQAMEQATIALLGDRMA
jgi:hypothetical protein